MDMTPCEVTPCDRPAGHEGNHASTSFLGPTRTQVAVEAGKSDREVIRAAAEDLAKLGVYPTGNRAVTPVSDLIEHDDFSDECPCGPDLQYVDGGIVYLHHSLDGREADES